MGHKLHENNTFQYFDPTRSGVLDQALAMKLRVLHVQLPRHGLAVHSAYTTVAGPDAGVVPRW